MARTIKRRAKQHLPGGGFDANGSPKQGKAQVWGKITVSNYKHGGESLAPVDLGLRTIEWLDLKFEEAIGGNSGGNQRSAYWSASAQQFYCLEASGSVAGGPMREISATSSPVLLFTACGDDQAEVELV